MSPDGRTLAYQPASREFRTWKRYRGGLASEIWLFNLESGSARNLTDNPANDSLPMWHGDTLYFLSDRGPAMRSNIWAIETATGETRQMTHFKDFDVHFPAIGPEEIVFEAGGSLYLMSLATGESREVSIEVITDEATLRPRTVAVGDSIESGDISPHRQESRVRGSGRDPDRSCRAWPGAQRHPEVQAVVNDIRQWSPDGRSTGVLE